MQLDTSPLDTTTLLRFVHGFVFAPINGQRTLWRKGYATAHATLHPQSSVVPGQPLTPANINPFSQDFCHL